MKVALVAVCSLDGKITKGQSPDIYSWTSKEDQKYFFKKIEHAKLIVMGSKTYKQAKKFIKHKKGRLRIVLTRSPKKYSKEKIDGILEFSSSSPKELTQRFKNSKIEEMLVVGGSEINSSFLKENLVDKLYLTIEPRIFGTGKNIASVPLNSDFHLISIKKLNKKGTLYAIYEVDNE